jgi:hypothetical protein
VSDSLIGIQAGSGGCSARVTSQRGGPARLCDSGLAGRLVLRAGKVAGLVLDNLDWRAGEILVRQGPAVRAPLPAEVGSDRRLPATGTAGERAAARIDNYLGFPAGISGAELEVRIPKLHQGSYFRSFLEPRRRSGRALWRSPSRPTSAGPTPPRRPAGGVAWAARVPLGSCADLRPSRYWRGVDARLETEVEHLRIPSCRERSPWSPEAPALSAWRPLPGWPTTARA